MSTFNDKEDTFVFQPEEREKKPQLDRSGYDEYSNARRGVSYETEDTSSKKLLYIAIALAVLLIIAVVAGIFILNAGKEPNNNIPENEIVGVIPEDEEEEEEEAPEITLVCSMVFDSTSVFKRDEGYTVLADLYDKDFYKFDNRKLIINKDTDIREKGKRVSAEALIYLIENMAGDAIVFDGEIRESDNTLISISFDSSEWEEETPPEEENPEEPVEEPSEEDPAEGEEIPSEESPNPEPTPAE